VLDYTVGQTFKSAAYVCTGLDE